jgi:hypothetical protein
VVAEFLASPPARQLAALAVVSTAAPFAVDLAAVEAVARRIVEYAGEYDPGRLLRVSPAKWETFAFDWWPRQTVSPGELDVLAPVLRAWTDWAGRPLSDTARTELAAALEEILAELAAHRSVAT